MQASVIESIITALMFFVALVPFVIVFGILCIPLCTGCETETGKYPFVILKIICIVLIFALSAVPIAINSSKEYFIDHFDEYKCKPWFMPFVSSINPKISAIENYKTCYGSIGLSMIGGLTKPMVTVTQSIGTGLNSASEGITNANAGVSQMATAAATSLERTNTEVSGYQAVIMYMFLKVKALFDKSMALLFNFYYALVSVLDLVNIILEVPNLMRKALHAFYIIFIIATTVSVVIFVSMIALAVIYSINPFTAILAPLQYSVASSALITVVSMSAVMAAYAIMYVPIAKLYDTAESLSYCCFAPETPIVMNDGTTCPISKLNVGDILQNNILVRGIVKAESKVNDWYEFGRYTPSSKDVTTVSGAHYFWDIVTTKWRRVDDMLDRHDVKKISNIRSMPNERFCLVTDSHTIPTIDGWFADFQESSDPTELEQSSRLALEQLNPGIPSSSSSLPQYVQGEAQSGLTNTTKICMGNNSMPRDISDIRIGDILSDGVIVKGVYCVQFNITAKGTYVNNIWLPSDQIYFNNEKQQWVMNTSGKLYTPPFKYGYHLITTSGDFEIYSEKDNNVRIRDFLELPNCLV